MGIVQKSMIFIWSENLQKEYTFCWIAFKVYEREETSYTFDFIPLR